MKSFGVVVLSTFLLVLSGCATSVKYEYDYTPTVSQTSFTVSDKRPAHEKDAKVLSLSIMSSKYGIYRLGDEQVVPDRMKYLQEQLQLQAGDLLASKNVVVESFSLHNDIQKSLRRSATAGAFFGGAGMVLNAKGDANVTAELHLSVGSKMVSSIGKSDYVADIHSPKYQEVLPANIKNAMDLAINDVVKKLKSNHIATGY